MTDHRQLGVDLFNHAWTLMGKAKRTPEEDDELLHAAHASAYHWLRAGTAKNRVRSEWQLARVYSVLGRSEPAVHHANRCLRLAGSADDLEDWDLPFAYEALARAHLAAGNRAEAARYADKARALGEQIADAEDRDHLMNELRSLGAVSER